MTGRLVRATPAQAIPLFTDAFARDPMFKYFTGLSDPMAQTPMRKRIVAFITHLHAAAGHQIWGWQVDGALAGCALVVDKAHHAPQRLMLLKVLCSAVLLGFGTLSRLNAYARRRGRGRPEGVSHFLVLVGLADKARGKGIGGPFLQALHAHSGLPAHWALNTENPANLAFYERLGYLLYGQETLGAVTIYKFHRPALTEPH
ncbi:MAG: hypothetical protein WD046_11715 [Paracoccaceae bacterium]